MKLVMVAVLLAGCGGGTKEPVEPTTAPVEPAQPVEPTTTGDANAQDVPLPMAPSPAGEQIAIAAKSNEDGKELMFAQRYAEASARFRDAVARVPEPTYFFNLCTSLFQEGKFSEALTSCDAVASNSPTAELQAKTDKLVEKIEAEAKAQGIHLGGGTGGGANNSSQAELAAKLDAEGTKLVKAKKYTEASMKFREAVARVPDPSYFFNLCTSLYMEGKFSEALTSCNAVEKNQPAASLRTKTKKLIAKIHAEAKRQGTDTHVVVDPPETQATIAAKANEDGKQLMFASKYAEASAKFRDAVARVPEPTYFFNLCTSLFQEGKFNEALTSCAGGKRNHPTAALATKLDAMIKRIRDEARAQNVPLDIH